MLPSQDSLHLFLLRQFLHPLDLLGVLLSVHKDTSLVVELVETKMVDPITQVVEEAVVMEAHLVMVVLRLISLEEVEVDLLVDLHHLVLAEMESLLL